MRTETEKHKGEFSAESSPLFLFLFFYALEAVGFASFFNLISFHFPLL